MDSIIPQIPSVPGVEVCKNVALPAVNGNNDMQSRTLIKFCCPTTSKASDDRYLDNDNTDIDIDICVLFQVNLGRTPDMSSISNMPISQEAVPIGDTGYVWDRYEDSLRMSTYLLAFIVSDFSYRVSAPTPNNVQFRIWSRAAATNQTVWAAEIGPQILSYYEADL